jgi:hypothetical protein
VFFFFFLLFMAGKLKSRCFQLGGVTVIVSLTVVVGRFFSKSPLHFWSQIYTTPLFFPRHTPLNRAPRHRPLQSPEAQATVVVGVQRVACTHQRDCCSLARVTATPLFFWPCTVLVEVYSG